MEGFKILFTDFDHILEKSGETIQSRIQFKGGYLLGKYGMFEKIHADSMTIRATYVKCIFPLLALTILLIIKKKQLREQKSNR